MGVYRSWRSGVWGLVGLAVLACPFASALAQDSEERPSYQQLAEENRRLKKKLEEGGPNLGRISLDIGADFTTHYFFRGVLQEDQGFIVQPYANVGFTVFEGDGVVNSVTLTTGIWNSFHGEQTGAVTPGDPDGEAVDSWYEADLSAGVSATVLDDWDVGVSYIAYTSPNDAFDTVEEVDLTVGYDDSNLLGDWALSPSLTFAFETGNTLLGSDLGTYLGIDFGPSFQLIKSDAAPLTLSVPVTVGLSLGNYYEDANDSDNTFGFTRVGVDLSMPLKFIPDDLGTWTVHGGPSFMFLGANNDALNNGDAFEVVGTLGLNISY